MADKDKKPAPIQQGKKGPKVSRGERPSVAPWIKKMARRSKRPAQRLIDQLEAYRNGFRVVLTVPNPNKEDTRARFVRVDAKTVWGVRERERKMAPKTEKVVDGA